MANYLPPWANYCDKMACRLLALDKHLKFPNRDRGDAPPSHCQTCHEGSRGSGKNGLQDPPTVCGSLGWHRGGNPRHGTGAAGEERASAGKKGGRELEILENGISGRGGERMRGGRSRRSGGSAGTTRGAANTR